MYYDGQFDDARFLISLVQTAAEQGAVLLNYAPVIALKKSSKAYVDGVVAYEIESGREIRARAKVVINATGAFVDGVRALAEPSITPMIAPSQGIHLVFDRSFLPKDTAVMVPHTSDGRVMFAIPWNGHTLIGTTDTPIQTLALDPKPLQQEIDFILHTAALYLHKSPTRADVLSMFAGIRPLVKNGDAKNTAALSRDHSLRVDDSGLLTITGGKWTTYRNMAEDCVNHAAMLAGLDEKPCVTKQLNVHGYLPHAERLEHLAVYGSDAAAIKRLGREDASLRQRLHAALPYTAAQVVWAARHEYARTVDDVLSRRLRATFLNARAAIDMAPRVAELMAAELGCDAAWQRKQIDAFTKIARGYLP